MKALYAYIKYEKYFFRVHVSGMCCLTGVLGLYYGKTVTLLYTLELIYHARTILMLLVMDQHITQLMILI